VAAVLVPLAVAAIFAERLGQAIAGALVAVAGIFAIAFRLEIAALQQRLAETGVAPESWSQVRPFTLLLWGGGVMLVGVSWMWFAYTQ